MASGPAVIVVAEAAAALEVVCGVSLLERLLRTLERIGVTGVRLLTGDPERIAAALAPPSWARAGVAVEIVLRPRGAITVEQLRDAWPEAAERVLVVSAGYIYDRRLLKTLAARQAAAVLVDRGRIADAALLPRAWAEAHSGEFAAELAAGLASGSLAPLELENEPRYIPSMRRELRPLCVAAPVDEASRREADRIILDAAQKQALDFPAYFHAPIETWLVSKLCRTRITPNQLSFWGNVVAWIGTGLFASGRIGAGVIVALIVGVLDGVDGKQARVKVEDTKGGKLEHWFDGIFEVSWMVALAFWFWRSGQIPHAFWLMGLLFLAEAVDGVAKLLSIVKLGRQIDDVAPFDRLVRLVGGRRNVYVWVLAFFVAIGRPVIGYTVIPWWEAATAVVHVPRVLWLLARRRWAGGK